MTVLLKEINEQIEAGKIDEALEALNESKATEETRSELAFLRGYVKERARDWEAAYEEYERALELDPSHAKAAFRAALLCDRFGEDEDAMSLYRQALVADKSHVNALVNLAILYEDHEELGMARSCVKAVLEEHPEHVRARQILRSIESSQSMYYDEANQRDRDVQKAMMSTPISDFELSVRSRNCLKQMNIRNLGDLLKITEPELLSYKNFGETSLVEIKAMLAAKGLRLGQAIHAQASSTRPLATPFQQASAPVGVPHSVLNKPVSELELSVRSRKCLQRIGAVTLNDVVRHSESELLSIKNFGQTSLDEIKEQLALLGLSLRDS